MKYMLFILCVAMLIFCIIVSINPKNEITKVELGRSGAWSDRGGAISVDSALNYKFYYTYLGRGDKPMSGYYIGKVTSRFWDTLNRKLESINYKTIRATDDTNAVDVNYYELIVHWKNGKRRIVRMRNFNSADSSVMNVLEWLNDSYRRVRFTKEVKVPIKFETTYGLPLPIPNIDQVKFPPPSHRKRRIATD